MWKCPNIEQAQDIQQQAIHALLFISAQTQPITVGFIAVCYKQAEKHNPTSSEQ